MRQTLSLSLFLSLYSIQASIPLDCTYPRCVSRRGREPQREREREREIVGGERVGERQGDRGIKGVNGEKERRRTGGWKSKGGNQCTCVRATMCQKVVQCWHRYKRRFNPKLMTWTVCTESRGNVFRRCYGDSLPP